MTSTFKTRCRIKNAYACVVFVGGHGQTENVYVDEDGIPWFPITREGKTKEMYMYHPLRGYIEITPPVWSLSAGDTVMLTGFRAGR
jgi:hypothetical protein